MVGRREEVLRGGRRDGIKSIMRERKNGIWEDGSLMMREVGRKEELSRKMMEEVEDGE